jgi:hypothetical protein
MTHGDSLVMAVEATQLSLEQRLARVVSGPGRASRARDGYAAIDAFMSATSRHLGAVEAVLLGAVRHSAPDGHALVHAYVHASKDLEATLSLVKARLYGEAHSVNLDWRELWIRTRAQLAEHNRLETRLVEALIEHGEPAVVDGLARRLFDAETHAPTRPHPMLPHLGWLGRVSRRLWARADAFWDAAEGRVIPAPVRPAARRHDSLVAQYVVADPRFDDHARLLEHRHARRRP